VSTRTDFLAIVAYLRLGILLLLLAACTPTVPEEEEPATPVAQATVESELAETAPLPTPAVQPTVERTPVPNPAWADDTLWTAGSSAVPAWNFAPYPFEGTLLARQTNGYRVDPDWAIASVNIFLKLDEEAYYYEAINNLDRTTAIELKEALTELYPTHQYLTSGSSATWAIEIIGQDGQRLDLKASGNSALANPWNVAYNGQRFAQFNGALTNVALTLLQSASGQTIADASHFAPFQAQFATDRSETQWGTHFTGLLPISDSFWGSLSLAEQTIRGSINVGNDSSDPFFGEYPVLQRVELGAERVECAIEFMYSAYYAYTCPIERYAEAGGSFRLPIYVTMTKDNGETLAVEGELLGFWGEERVLPQMAVEFLYAFNNHPDAGRLLANHLVVGAKYTAALSAESTIMGTYSGEVVLAGQLNNGDQTIRYTITTPFVIHDGVLQQWVLNDDDVTSFLADLLALPFSQRVLAHKPEAILNLWYDEYVSEYGSFMLGGTGPCADLPSGSLPNPEMPYRAFGFDDHWTTTTHPILLYGRQPVPLSLDIYSGGENPYWPLLSPVFDTGDLPPFRGININYQSVWFWVPDETVDRTHLEAIFQSLPGEHSDDMDTFWTAEGATLKIVEDGTIEMIGCTPVLVPTPTPLPFPELTPTPVPDNTDLLGPDNYVVFEIWHVNHAWGFYSSGAFIDNTGRLFTFSQGADIDQATNYPASRLLARYGNNIQLIGEIDPAELAEQMALIPQISAADLTPTESFCNDFGYSYYLAYEYDAASQSYHSNILYQAGDSARKNEGEAAQSLIGWLDQVAANAGMQPLTQSDCTPD
jgi:hypothetical protein